MDFVVFMFFRLYLYIGSFYIKPILYVRWRDGRWTGMQWREHLHNPFYIKPIFIWKMEGWKMDGYAVGRALT
ncbi:hypothetical protein SAMN04488023_12614 [Pedobacter rhizosphaerae]|uniref:Uncharacterized protein n=1 Tax=Pedobacter rhizosphaerae TaxID=390241 RepID=A0A1H9U020_9SPHI|nr:hypothetical protein SAMN04488023_12614 [Pedobacter rhizosphaerae]